MRRFQFSLIVGSWLTGLIAILVFSMAPASSELGGLLTPQVANAGHLPAYALLGGVTAALAYRLSGNASMSAYGAAALLCWLGLSIEIWQPLVGRSRSVLDLLRDIGGVLVGLLAWRIIMWMRNAARFRTRDKS